MREQLTHTIEDYLKTIYEITTNSERASTNRIADALEITPASVTGMLKKLSETDPPLVVYQRHRGAVLTKEGEQVALEILRHHRLLEMYLHQMLGYEWDQVHAEADRLEHVISEQFEEKIAQALGDPQRDPHGDPIPSRDLKMPASSALTMSELRPGQEAIICRVSSSDSKLLRYLREHDLIPGTFFVVVAYSDFDEVHHIQIEKKKTAVAIGYNITSQIYVDLIKEKV